MRHHFIALFALAAIALPLSARAEVPSDAVARETAAAAEFATLAQEAQARGTVPLPTDPKAQPILTQLVDPALLGTPPYSAKDLAKIDAIFTKARGAYGVYMSYAQGAKTAPEMQTRAMAIQDELARFSGFFLRAQGVMMPALADFVAHLKPADLTETRLQGLRRLRGGILQMVQGAGMMARGGMNPDNQAILVNALADTAAPIAAGLPPATRAQVSDQLREQFTGLPAPLQARIEEVRKAMANPACSGLCTLD